MKSNQDNQTYESDISKIQEVTGINDVTQINKVIAACRDNKTGRYEMNDVINMLIQDDTPSSSGPVSPVHILEFNSKCGGACNE